MIASVKPNLQLIYVTDIVRSTNFYTWLFKTAPVFSSPRYVAFAADAQAEALFALWTGGEAPTTAPQRFGEIGILMPSNHDVDALFAEWRYNPEITIVRPPYDEVFGRTFLVKDPDGHIIRVSPRD